MEVLLSVMGMYNYDSTIFDGIILPEGVDKDTAINMILVNCAEQGMVYTDPAFFKRMLPIWCKTKIKGWEKLYHTTVVKYDPIENYNRTEEWMDTEETIASAENSSNTTDGGTSTEQVQGFDSASFVDRNKTTADGNSNTTGKSNQTENRINTRKGVAKGNIGVTTTQQMLEEERRIAKFDIYSQIVADFKRFFCIMVY